MASSSRPLSRYGRHLDRTTSAYSPLISSHISWPPSRSSYGAICSTKHASLPGGHSEGSNNEGCTVNSPGCRGGTPSRQSEALSSRTSRVSQIDTAKHRWIDGSHSAALHRTGASSARYTQNIDITS